MPPPDEVKRFAIDIRSGPQQALSQAENIRNQALVSHANARATLQYVTGRDPLQ